MRRRRLRWLALAPLLAGCLPSFPEAQDQFYDRRAGPVEFRVTQGSEGVITVAIRITEPGETDLAALEARCRREIVTIGLAEAARRRMPPPARVFDRFITGNAQYDPRSGTSRCIAAAPVFPSDGRGFGL